MGKARRTTMSRENYHKESMKHEMTSSKTKQRRQNGTKSQTIQPSSQILD